MTGKDWAGDDVDWVPVLVVWNPADAALIVARLRDKDIPAFARPEAASPAIPVTAGMMSEIEVMVPEPMEDRALRVLEDLGFLAGQDETDAES